MPVTITVWTDEPAGVLAHWDDGVAKWDDGVTHWDGTTTVWYDEEDDAWPTP